MNRAINIAPSILASNSTHLAEEMQAAGADYIHVDVMDGHFVPDITIGPSVVRSLRQATKLPLDVHLMISDPMKHTPTPSLETGEQRQARMATKKAPGCGEPI